MTEIFTTDYIDHEVKVLDAEIYGCQNSLKFIADSKANDKYLSYLEKQFTPVNNAYNLALGKFVKNVHDDLLLSQMRAAHDALRPVQAELSRLDAERKADYKTYTELNSRVSKARTRREFLLAEKAILTGGVDEVCN